jgi:hypothetical protein
MLLAYVYLIVVAVGAACVLLYKALEFALTGIHEHVEKTSTAEAHAFANKFVAILHSVATVSFAVMVIATFPYQSGELLFALKHRGASSQAHCIRKREFVTSACLIALCA